MTSYPFLDNTLLRLRQDSDKTPTRLRQDSRKYFKKTHGHFLEIAFWTFIGHLLDIF